MTDPHDDEGTSSPRESLLEGRISVLAALRGRSRSVRAIYLASDRDEQESVPIQRAAQAAGVTVIREERSEIDRRAQGSRHGGVLAMVGPRRFLSVDELLDTPGPSFTVMIDGVEDPYNFGSAVRSLYAAGVDGLVVRPRNWLSAAGIVARASAGASELLPIAVAETASDAAAACSPRGLTIACASRENAVSIYEADLTQPLFLLIGGEQRGITRSFLRQADIRLHVPYARGSAAELGTAAVAAVIGFEVMRQRSLL